MLIPGVSKSDKPSLINIIYHKKTKQCKDYLSIVYKINDVKKIHHIYEPTMDFYYANDKLRTSADYYPIENCTKYNCAYNDILRKIADLSDNKDFFYDRVKSGNYGSYRQLGALHLVPNVFGSDIDIEDYYIFLFTKEYGINYHSKLSKGYFDIETDGRLGNTLDVEHAPAPINVITYISSKSNKFYVFLLKKDGYLGQDEMLNNIQDFKKRCHDEFMSEFGEKEYIFLAYEDERELIEDFISLIKHDSVDFLTAWNGLKYDYPYIVNRLELLGGSKFSLCDVDEFDENNLSCNLYIDNRNFEPNKNNSSLTVSSKIIFMDSMIIYASNRTAGDALRSFKLDDICNDQLGVGKIKHEYGFRDFAYMDYINFVFYSIQDTLLLEKLENVIEDVENVYNKAMENITRPNKVFRQTIFLNNRSYQDYYNTGMIKGNNQNSRYNGAEDIFKFHHPEDEMGKVPGALVASPMLNGEYGVIMNGRRSDRIFANCIDMDYSSEYPSATISHNISNDTMIGKVKVRDFHAYNERMYHDSEFPYIQGGNLLDDLTTRAFFKFGTKWLSLPTVRELILKYKNILTNGNTDRTFLRREETIVQQDREFLSRRSKFSKSFRKFLKRG